MTCALGLRRNRIMPFRWPFKAALFARLLADRFPYNRAYMETMTSCRSLTMSSVFSSGSITMIRRPWADNADAT
jgi:hypothetical protein